MEYSSELTPLKRTTKNNNKQEVGRVNWILFVWRDRPGEGSLVGDWRFDYPSGSDLQSQVKCRLQMMVFMSLVLVLIVSFCPNVIGRQNVKVVVIGRLLLLSIFDPSIVCLSVSFYHVNWICQTHANTTSYCNNNNNNNNNTGNNKKTGYLPELWSRKYAIKHCITAWTREISDF